MNGHEWLSLWYLRLNGYFTLPNFYAHGRRGPLTEVDVLGARFPHSSEFEDDKALNIPEDGIDLVLAEAKGKRIEELNGPWGSPDRGALDYVLRRVGIASREEVATLTKKLYTKRAAKTVDYNIRIVCFAEAISDELLGEKVTFIPWKHALKFIHSRFSKNNRLKSDHEAWDEFGQFLWGQLNFHEPPEVSAFFHEWETRLRPGQQEH